MSDQPASLWVDCPPKLNLYLRIVRRREDGYHELETVFQSVSGGDRLIAEAADAVVLECSDPELPVDERNLVVRAARLLQQRYPATAERGVRFQLEKRTPMGAGMGGGSVDAAAALVLLNELWGLKLEREELAALGAELGSDVPFFLYGGTALARGRGEQLQPVATAPVWFVLLRPPVAVSTPWAYRQWDASACGGASVEEFMERLTSGDPEQVAASLRNDLEAGVAAGVAEIAAARQWLLEQGVLGARMTGSGSVVFGIARDEAHAREIAARPAPFNSLLWPAQALPPAASHLTPVSVF